MDHQGRANDPGTTHYEITNREAAFAQETAKSGATTVSQKKIEEGVDGTAQVATEGAQSRQKGNGPAWDGKDKVTPERKEKGQLSDKAKDQQAKELAKKENKGKKAAGSGKGKGKKPNKPSQKGPSKKDAKKARECIKDAWKQSLNEMRDNVVNEHSTAAKSAECKKEIADYNKNRKKGQPEAKSYTDLPAARRKKVDAAVAKKVDARQKELEKSGAAKAGKTGKPHPTEEECLEYQANWLYNNRRANGTYPPLQGRVPDSGTTTTTKSGSGPNQKKL